MASHQPLPEIWMRLTNRKLLAQLMATQGISARQLARAAGWKSHTYMQRLLRGEVTTLETEPALRIAHELRVPVDLLFLTRASTDRGRTTQRRRTAAA